MDSEREIVVVLHNIEKSLKTVIALLKDVITELGAIQKNQ